MELLIKPVASIHDSKVFIIFGKKVFEIHPRSNIIFLNGEKWDPKNDPTHYNKNTMKIKNIKREKRRVGKPYHYKNKVMIINKGGDGRLFWLTYSEQAFKQFRGNHYWECSYWNDGEEARFYLNDLTNPVKTWNLKEKEEKTGGQKNLAEWGRWKH